MVCAYLVSLNAAGKSIGNYPVRISVGASKPELLVRLEGGTTNVQVVRAKNYDELPGQVGSEVRWLTNAAAWECLSTRVADVADRNQKPVTNEVVREIYDGLVAKGACGSSSSTLPIEVLLR
jgi:hypothetical protein